MQPARQAGRMGVRAEAFFFYDPCFIIHKEDEVSRMPCSLLAGVPKLLHSSKHIHTHTLLLEVFLLGWV